MIEITLVKALGGVLIGLTSKAKSDDILIKLNEIERDCLNGESDAPTYLSKLRMVVTRESDGEWLTSTHGRAIVSTLSIELRRNKWLPGKKDGWFVFDRKLGRVVKFV